ncbi:MAG: hypothetical protein WD250_13150 [Egibacteraceae bacterium]
MTAADRATLRDLARQVAADAPPLSAQQVRAIRRVIRTAPQESRQPARDAA